MKPSICCMCRDPIPIQTEYGYGYCNKCMRTVLRTLRRWVDEFIKNYGG